MFLLARLTFERGGCGIAPYDRRCVDGSIHERDSSKKSCEGMCAEQCQARALRSPKF